MAKNNLLVFGAVAGLAYLFLKNNGGGLGVQTNPAPSGAAIKAPSVSIKIVG